MTSSIFWSYGFLYWMATILFLVQCRADCGEFSVGCDCSIANQSGHILLKNCQNGTVNLPELYHMSKTGRSLIEIRDSENVTLENMEKNSMIDEMRPVRMREVSLLLENVTRVTIKNKTFDQLVINAAFNNVKNLILEEKCFSSCWGTVWLFNSPITTSSGPFSSSDIVVYKSDATFSIHGRPELTPRQKLHQVYKIADKLDDLEITIYAVLALIGAVILTLISLTIVVSRKFVPPSSRLENLPDVVRVKSPVPQRKNNPVTKVSRISRVVFQKRKVNNMDPQRPKANKYIQSSRPPLPPPRDI